MEVLRKLNKLNLDYERTISYVRDQLSAGNVLSQELLHSLDFGSGQFFTLLPEDANLDKIYDFLDGCILPQNKTHEYIDEWGKKCSYTWIPTLKNEMSNLLFKKMTSKDSYACIFEDVVRQLGDRHLEFFDQHGVSYLDEIYYIINKNNTSQELIFSAIGKANALWHLLFILTEIDESNVIGKEITLDNIKKFCKKIRLLVLGAYDGEGYLLWEPGKIN